MLLPMLWHICVCIQRVAVFSNELLIFPVVLFLWACLCLYCSMEKRYIRVNIGRSLRYSTFSVFIVAVYIFVLHCVYQMLQSKRRTVAAATLASSTILLQARIFYDSTLDTHDTNFLTSQL